MKKKNKKFVIIFWNDAEKKLLGQINKKRSNLIETFLHIMALSDDNY